MGSERVEMGQSVEDGGGEQNHTPGRSSSTRAPPDACCFCWCCCCSCSCLTVRPAKEEKMTTISEEQEEADIDQTPQLSLEEVQSWAESFEHLMKSAHGLAHFRQFLKSEFSEENLNFWLICEDLKKEPNNLTVEQTVKQIFEDYVSVMSPKEVSLDSRVREVINRNMQQPSSSTFEEAQLQIFMLMQRDSYPRFMGSSMYADLRQKLEQPEES